MDYPFTVPGYEQVPLVVRTSLWQGPKILHRGVPLKKVGRLSYRLDMADGRQLPLQIKLSGGGFVPRVIHNEQVIEVAPPLPGYAQLLIYLPMGLIFVGGAIGGLCGGIGTAINVAIFRGDRSSSVKIVLSLLVTFCAAIVWFAAAIAITLALRKH